MGSVGTEMDSMDESNRTEIEELQLREMQCELNMLTRPDGSVVFSQGQTVVMAAVYGPVEGKLSNSDIYNANVEVSFNATAGLPSVRDRLRETIIKQSCESALILSLHPRTTILLNIQEMQNFGGIIACSVNACCLALINAGLPMNFLFASVYCVIKQNGQVLLDPSSKEAADSAAEFTFVFDSVSKSVISSTSSGNFGASQYRDCLLKCQKGSDSVFKYYRDIVKKYAPTM